jgi:hypothetical protein
VPGFKETQVSLNSINKGRFSRTLVIAMYPMPEGHQNFLLAAHAANENYLNPPEAD